MTPQALPERAIALLVLGISAGTSALHLTRKLGPHWLPVLLLLGGVALCLYSLVLFRREPGAGDSSAGRGGRGAS